MTMIEKDTESMKTTFILKEDKESELKKTFDNLEVALDILHLCFLQMDMDIGFNNHIEYDEDCQKIIKLEISLKE